jgi:hypothetical protein
MAAVLAHNMMEAAILAATGRTERWTTSCRALPELDGPDGRRIGNESQSWRSDMDAIVTAAAPPADDPLYPSPKAGQKPSWMCPASR